MKSASHWYYAHLLDTGQSSLLAAHFVGIVPSPSSWLTALSISSNTHQRSSNASAHPSISSSPWSHNPTPHHPSAKRSIKNLFGLPFRISSQSESTALLGGSRASVVISTLSSASGPASIHHWGWRLMYHACQSVPNFRTYLVTSGMSVRSRCHLSHWWTASGRFLLLRVFFFPYCCRFKSVTVSRIYVKVHTLPSGYPSISSNSNQLLIVCSQRGPSHICSSALTHGTIHLGHFSQFGWVSINEGPESRLLATLVVIAWAVVIFGAWKGVWKEAVGLQVEEKVVERVLEAQTSTSCRETFVSPGCS